MGVVVDKIEDLHDLLDAELEPSDWVTVDQDRIDTFAGATGDCQWIHTDPVRAATGPFGKTIAHGYLTLSLLIPMWSEILDVKQVSSKVNYGLNKVRFPAPVPVDAKVRTTAKVVALEQIPGGVQIVVDAVIESDASNKPVCVAQPIFRFYA